MMTATTLPTGDDLAFPDFLRRTAKEKRHTYRDRPHHYTRPDRPDGERWERAERFRIHLHDQAPRIGSGIRSCWVFVGRKRVALSAAGIKQVIPRAVWNEIARKATKLED